MIESILASCSSGPECFLLTVCYVAIIVCFSVIAVLAVQKP